MSTSRTPHRHVVTVAASRAALTPEFFAARAGRGQTLIGWWGALQLVSGQTAGA